MTIDLKAMVKSKIMWANVLGLAVAVAAVFGVAPEMTGKTAEYATMGLMVLNMILRTFSNNPIAK